MLTIPLALKIKTDYINDKGEPIYKNYFPPPPIIESTYIYQDINNDHQLREQVIDFFNKKLFKWITIKKDLMFLKNKINNDNSKYILYKIIRRFVKKYNINWYDLIDNYDLVKYYIFNNIKKIF
jgi:hypothetical protein